MSEESKPTQPATEQKRDLRRRLLKAGVIGAPVVLTLKSGSAWANVSLTCVERPNPADPYFKVPPHKGAKYNHPFDPFHYYKKWDRSKKKYVTKYPDIEELGKKAPSCFCSLMTSYDVNSGTLGGKGINIPNCG